MKITKTFYAVNRGEWRAWLEEHHATETEIWLVYYKASIDKSAVSYDDSVEEALCFGWVDSLIQKIDDEKYARKFTPRKAGSKWAESNKRRVAKLVKEGRMTEVGLAKIDYPLDEPPPLPTKRELIVPDWLNVGLQTSPQAWENFSKLPPSYKQRYIAWISDVQEEETRQRRIQEAIGLLEKNEKLGMK